MRKTCPGCRQKFWKRGGVVRFPDDKTDLGYYEIDICKDCANTFERIDREKKDIPNDDLRGREDE